MTPCSKCHFVYEDLTAREVPPALRHHAREIRERLGALLDEPGGVERLRTRHRAETWSALEYAGHVRDVLLTQHGRIYRALVEDVPAFSPMQRDERVRLGGYNTEDPATTATEVTIAADLFARLLARLSAAEWSRRCIYNLPEPTEVDVAWLDALLYSLVALASYNVGTLAADLTHRFDELGAPVVEADAVVGGIAHRERTVGYQLLEERPSLGFRVVVDTIRVRQPPECVDALQVWSKRVRRAAEVP